MQKFNVKYIITFLILYLCWALIIPIAFKFNVNTIKDVIQKTSGYDVEFVNPKLSLWTVFHAKLSAKEIDILNKDKSKAVEVKNPKINVRILPLIIGRVHIKAIEAKSFSANFSLDNKNLYLGDYLIQKLEKQPNIRVDRVKLKKYYISFYDKKSKLPIKLFGHDLYYKMSRKSFIVKGYNTFIINNSKSIADFNIKIPKKHNLKKAKLNINVKNLDLSPLSNILQIFTSDMNVIYRVNKIKGIINIQSDNDNLNMCMSDFALIMRDSARSIIFPKDFKINTNYKITSKTLEISDFVAKGAGVNLNINGEIDKYQTMKPRFDLNINIPKSDMREIALMLPPVVTSQFNVYRLKMYPFYGDIDGILKVTGKAPTPDINGNIHIKNGYLIKPVANAKKADINIDFIGQKINLDIVVPTSLREVVYITGMADTYKENAVDLLIRSSKSIDLKTAQTILNPLHEILRFNLGPVPIMDLRGLGSANMRVIGTKKDPHIWGYLRFRKAIASFNKISFLVLKNASGELTFNDQDAHFINKTGTVNNQPFTIDGMSTLFGNIDFDIIAHNQPLAGLDRTLRTSPMLKPLDVLIPKIEDAKGNIDLDLNLTGKIPDINKIIVNDNVTAKGTIILKNNSLKMNNIPIKRASGKITFENLNAELNVNTILDDMSKINVSGRVKDNIAKVAITAPKLNVRTFTKDKYKELDDCWISLKASYHGKVNNIELNKVKCSIDVLRSNVPVKNIKIITGQIRLKNSNLEIKNLYGLIKHNPFYLNLEVRNLGKTTLTLKHARVNANLHIRDFDLSTLNFCKYSTIFPQEIRRQLNNFKILYGNSDINAKIRNNRINADVELNNARGVYSIPTQKEAMQVPIKVINGQIVVKNNRIFLNKVNTLVDTMPVLVYGSVDNIFRKPNFNIHINSKLVQRTFDKYWNINKIYPIKVKGDILLGSRISGTLDRINTKLFVKMEENSNIYYLGATLGDIENPITINSDFDILKNNIIRLNKFQYNKLISSQNNTQTVFPLLMVKGGITYYNNKFYKFDDLIVKTDAPTDARIFNVIFRKPTIKHGQFTSDLVINGKSTSPQIIGDMEINGIDMPFLSTTLKDLSLKFDRDNIYLKSKGEILSNAVLLNAVVKNKIASSYDIEKANIYLKQCNLNKVISDLKQLELKAFNENQEPSKNTTLDFRNAFTCKDLNIAAGSIVIKNIKATNLKAKCSLDERMQLAVDNFSFNIADGNVDGHVNYNLLNNMCNLKLNTQNVNANDLLIALFDLPNQIYGKLTGTIDLSSNMTNERRSKETLSGYGTFIVKDGKMPKLGSMEYLLKAGNLVKSGVTGLSVNSILDLMTPVKTGTFSSIAGSINIRHGVADNIEIKSSGKDLNLFIKGKYNFVTEIADMLVYGQLSRNVSSILGKVGNVSINTLFNVIPGINLSENGQLLNELNKIPAIELNSKCYRKFVVDILGNINGNNYVKSFKWVN